jgi:hypothetical protein
VAGGERAVDQPGAHEPRIQQQPHGAEPLAEQVQQQARAPELAAVGAAADQAQQSRHRADGKGVALDHRRQAQPALAAQELRPVRLGVVGVMHQRARRLGGHPLDHTVIDHGIPDRRAEQHRQHLKQGSPDPQPGPAPLLEEPVVRAPATREAASQDGVGDVAAFGGGRAQQQIKEGSARPRRHGCGNARDDAGQDGRDRGTGHWLNPSR